MIDDPIPYSLPTITHSVIISTRSPYVGYRQSAKFMPDYGGVLEIPGSNIKNNVLGTGLPFDLRPDVYHVPLSSPQNLRGAAIARPYANHVLITTSYLDSESDTNFSSISSVNGNLYLDSVEEIYRKNHNTYRYHTQRYAHLYYDQNILGLKLDENNKESLLVRFERCVKTLKLLASYEPDNCSEFPSSPIEESSKIKEKSGSFIRDACLNPFNRRILSVASEAPDQLLVNVYDLEHKSEPFHSIVSSSKLDLNYPMKFGVVSKPESRLHAPRIFESLKTTDNTIHQIDNIPSHLVNMLLTTDSYTALIDPREQSVGLTYCDRAKIPSFYPIEAIRRIQFSSKNDNQFYSLSNVHLRAFDTRYPNMPMNQINHMLDPADCEDNIDLRSIGLDSNDCELICIATRDRLCFCSFEQDLQSQLVNPKSKHPPYHDENPTKSDQVPTYTHSLSLRPEYDHSRGLLFSTLQLNQKGHLIIKKFPSSKGAHSSDKVYESQLQDAMRLEVTNETSDYHIQESCDLEARDIFESEQIETRNLHSINVLDSEQLVDIENRVLGSTRARERYEKMQDTLNRTD